MTIKNILNLIRYHQDKNDISFANEALEIARKFNQKGDRDIYEYIIFLLSNDEQFLPQIIEENFQFLYKDNKFKQSLSIPESIMEDVKGVLNAINQNVGINKFLFYGEPGTGKTETVRQIAKLLERSLYIVKTENLIDSKLGQTPKNIEILFNEINEIRYSKKAIILFDELDSLALDRINSNDIREMGRATSSFLKGLDNLNENIILFSTTNLYDKFDKALLRRFQAHINFNRYDREDLIQISEQILFNLLKTFKKSSPNIKMFRKIIQLFSTIPYPGELYNLISSSLAFSDPNKEYDYLRRLYLKVSNNNSNLQKMQEQDFSIREIEILTGVSKSSVARDLKEKSLINE
ncbi:ATP-binding protein [Mycoplasma crocodyli]|uniref:ATPase, AAA family n=1 Tax=Mycoplasma crocodyli (strain ATCC 51981 / MP145) TaxID=512564 RepID=D5E6A7_MYCCM|nr:ATP-binding protein [Mycoplasma crocodyli]ADE19491.1 ATPase, AAA family [Mycoplasma crocodyli MP145]